MWKKDDVPTTGFTPDADTPARTPLSVSTPTPPPPTPAASSSSGSRAPTERATIGRSITIRGDVTGNEDLLIQGRVDGSIDLKQHSVTIGSEGEVKASIAGRVVIVEGSVEGNISSAEQVVLRSSARVQGDITAPRLVLEDGARFRGGVDMGESPASANSDASSASAQDKRSSTPSGSTSSASVSSSSSDKGSEKSESSSDANGAKRKGTGAVAEANA